MALLLISYGSAFHSCSPSRAGRASMRVECVSSDTVSHGLVQIDGDAELDAFFAGNATNGTAENPYSLSGLSIDASASAYGIKITGTTRFLVIAGNVVSGNALPYGSIYASAGLVLENVTNVMVQGNTFNGTYNGITVGACSNINITSNFFINSTVLGLCVNMSTSCVVDGNKFWNCGVLVFGTVEQCLSLHMDVSNVVNDQGCVRYIKNWNGALDVPVVNGSQVIFVNCTDVELHDFSTERCSVGVQFIHSKGITIQDCDIAFNNLYNILGLFSEGSKVLRNEIKSGFYSVAAFGCNYTSFEGNDVSGAIADGIVLHSTNHVKVVGNVLDNNAAYNIKFVDSFNVTISNNRISNGEQGIGIAWDDIYASINHNVIYNCSFNGIDVAWSRDLLFTGNTIICCGTPGVLNAAGMRITQFVQNVSLSLNNFMNNMDANVAFGTMYDISWNVSMQGNYWSDYRSRYPHAVQGDSGTWLTPFELEGAPEHASTYTDYHPLVEPSIPDITILPSENISILNGTVGHSINWTLYYAGIGFLRYSILHNGTILSTGSWEPSMTLKFVVDALPIGFHNVTLVAEDGLGKTASSSIIVHVYAAEGVIGGYQAPLTVLFLVISLITSIFTFRRPGSKDHALVGRSHASG